MMNNISNIEGYRFKATDSLFIDANIWLDIYGPSVRLRSRTRIYSSAFRDICQAKCRPFIDVLVVSEFVNRYARTIHRQSQYRDQDFKIYRDTCEFADIAKDIADAVRKIVNLSQRSDSNWPGCDIGSILGDFREGMHDFNDLVIASNCKHNDMILITHDADFKDSDIAILTANPRLLAS